VFGSFDLVFGMNPKNPFLKTLNPGLIRKITQVNGKVFLLKNFIKTYYLMSI